MFWFGSFGFRNFLKGLGFSTLGVLGLGTFRV